MWTIPIDDKNEYFEKYLHLIKNTLDKEWKDLEIKAKKYKNAKPIQTEYGSYDPNDFFADMAYEIEEMEQLMYRSYIIGVFVFMESQISNLCELIGKKETFSYKDLKGNGISRSIKYLEAVLKIKFPLEKDTRNEFEIARIIRNALVHREGEIEDIDKQKITKYITDNPKILFLKEKTLSVTYEYAKSLINLNENICKNVEDYNKMDNDEMENFFKF